MVAGRGARGTWSPYILKFSYQIFSKRKLLSQLRVVKNEILSLSAPLEKLLWLPLENPLLVPHRKKSFRRPWVYPPPLHAHGYILLRLAQINRNVKIYCKTSCAITHSKQVVKNARSVVMSLSNHSRPHDGWVQWGGSEGVQWGGSVPTLFPGLRSLCNKREYSIKNWFKNEILKCCWKWPGFGSGPALSFCSATPPECDATLSFQVRNRNWHPGHRRRASVDRTDVRKILFSSPSPADMTNTRPDRPVALSASVWPRPRPDTWRGISRPFWPRQDGRHQVGCPKSPCSKMLFKQSDMDLRFATIRVARTQD